MAFLIIKNLRIEPVAFRDPLKVGTLEHLIAWLKTKVPQWWYCHTGNVKCLLASMAYRAVLFVALIISGSAKADVVIPIPGDPIRIESGMLQGAAMPSGVHAYLGIPFAAPPVRETRWKAPQPVKPWKGVYHADAFKPACLQTFRNSHSRVYYGEYSISEDCLYLNVWAPARSRPGSKLPVLVYIYGGGFFQGSPSWSLYDGRKTAERGIVQVNVSYRLGALGFMAHPALSKEGGYNGSGNWGIMDQIAALKWIQRNIASFGGDPSRVTIMGQSAGAWGVGALTLSPLATGTFSRAIALSGGSPAVRSLQRAEAEGVKLQHALGAKDIDELRTFGADRVLRKAEELDISLWPPVLDGYVSVARPADIFAAGKQNDVPILISTTASDASNGNPFTETHSVPEYLAAAAKVFGPNTPEFLKLFPVKVDSDVDRQASLITSQSGWMAQGAREWAAQQVKAGKSPAYVLLFDHPQPYSAVLPIEGVDPRRPVARHTDDIVYWLGTLDLLNELRTTRVWKDYDRKLSGELQEIVVNFASSGIPKSSSFTLPVFDPADQKLAYVGENYITVRKISVPQMEFLRDHPFPDSYVGLPQRPSE